MTEIFICIYLVPAPSVKDLCQLLICSTYLGIDIDFLLIL